MQKGRVRCQGRRPCTPKVVLLFLHHAEPTYVILGLPRTSLNQFSTLRTSQGTRPGKLPKLESWEPAHFTDNLGIFGAKFTWHALKQTDSWVHGVEGELFSERCSFQRSNEKFLAQFVSQTAQFVTKRALKEKSSRSNDPLDWCFIGSFSPLHFLCPSNPITINTMEMAQRTYCLCEHFYEYKWLDLEVSDRTADKNLVVVWLWMSTPSQIQLTLLVLRTLAAQEGDDSQASSCTTPWPEFIAQRKSEPVVSRGAAEYWDVRRHAELPRCTSRTEDRSEPGTKSRKNKLLGVSVMSTFRSLIPRLLIPIANLKLTLQVPRK